MAQYTCLKCKSKIEQPDDIFTIQINRSSNNPNINHICTDIKTVYQFHLTCLPQILSPTKFIPVICNCVDTRHQQFSETNNNSKPIVINRNLPTETNQGINSESYNRIYNIIHGGRNNYRSLPTIKEYNKPL